MQPPGSPCPFGTPFGALAPGAGQVFAQAGMYWSIVKGAFANALVKVVAVVLSVQVEGSGGDVRLTSFCRRQANGVPAWFTWTVWTGSAALRPLTPSHPPYRLSKLWVSS